VAGKAQIQKEKSGVNNKDSETRKEENLRKLCQQWRKKGERKIHQEQKVTDIHTGNETGVTLREKINSPK